MALASQTAIWDGIGKGILEEYFEHDKEGF